MEQSSAVETAVDRRVVNHATEMKLRLEWLIETVDDDGAARVKQAISGVTLKMTMPSGEGTKTVHYDSSDEKTPSGDAKRIADSYACLINQPVFVTITARGEITDVEIPEETMESIRNMPGSMEGRESLTLESIRDLFRHATAAFPESPMAAGETWTAERSFRIAPQTFKQTTTYTLAAQVAEGGWHEVNFVSSLELDADEAARQDAMVEIVDQSLDGKLLFDSAAGYCRESSSQTKLQTLAQYRDMEIKTSVTSSLKIEFKKQQD